MSNIAKSISVAMLSLVASTSLLTAQIIDRPTPLEWDNLVDGGAFKDRILPMEGEVVKDGDHWGAQCIQRRLVDNGIEDEKWSYWGGNIFKGDDGKYHLFLCGWLENSPKGHMEWHESLVFHTVSDTPHGPFENLGVVAKGHNPEMFRLSTGEYVLYVIDGYYTSDDLYGEWTYGTFDFDQRSRPIIEGLSNVTFAEREDGSYLAVCRGGGSWISRDGLSQLNQVTDKRAYPDIDGRFEDPVIWRDEVQYNMIVNDWYGRIAYYLRSKDGVDWITEDGQAYIPGVAVHKDGHVEDWFKFERMRVTQDERRRAYQANFAVCDTLKHFDLPNDMHSSKNIVLPLNPGMLSKITNEKAVTAATSKIEVLIESEEGFDALNEIDFATLRFGSHERVNYGKGSKVSKVKGCDGGVLLTFSGKESGLTSADFAAKIIGRSKSGEMLFSYCRIPGVNYIEPIISTEILGFGSRKCNLKVENFGQVASSGSKIEIYQIGDDGKEKMVASGAVGALEPYSEVQVSLNSLFSITKSGERSFRVKITTDDRIVKQEMLTIELQVAGYR